MTSKEALEGLIDAYISWRAFQTRECIENDYRYQKVLKDLDRLEELRDLYEIATKGNWNLKNENQKLKKAIEVIKKKGTNIGLLLNSSDYCIYNFYAKKQDLEDLSQQEFKFLKEVLEE